MWKCCCLTHPLNSKQLISALCCAEVSASLCWLQLNPWNILHRSLVTFFLLSVHWTELSGVCAWQPWVGFLFPLPGLPKIWKRGTLLEKGGTRVRRPQMTINQGWPREGKWSVELTDSLYSLHNSSCLIHSQCNWDQTTAPLLCTQEWGLYNSTLHRDPTRAGGKSQLDETESHSVWRDNFCTHSTWRGSLDISMVLLVLQ